MFVGAVRRFSGGVLARYEMWGMSKIFDIEPFHLSI